MSSSRILSVDGLGSINLERETTLQAVNALIVFTRGLGGFGVLLLLIVEVIALKRIWMPAR